MKRQRKTAPVAAVSAPAAPPEPVRMGRRSLLTPDIQATIVVAIESGSFDYVAAAAAGISERAFRFWVEWGAEHEKAVEEGRDAPQRADSARYGDFFAAVRAARASARQKAEARVYEEDPFKWLRYGPGRDRPGAPGWTDGDASGGVTEVTQGDLVIKTYWGRASEKSPPEERGNS